MASPVAHSFAGFWTFLAFVGRSRTGLAARCREYRKYLPQIAVLILLANLADFDFLPGFVLEGNANSLHRGFSHSLAAALFVALALSCIWRIMPGFWRSTLVYFTAYGSHLLIDLFTGTRIGWTHSGFGIPLFWPWSKEFSSPLILIFGVHHNNFASLFSLDNVWSCAYELLIFGAITVVIFALRTRKLKSQTTRPATRGVGTSSL
jgi:membrane-bound metal-dependent hydrolase YbcI (DUF457 family)